MIPALAEVGRSTRSAMGRERQLSPHARFRHVLRGRYCRNAGFLRKTQSCALATEVVVVGACRISARACFRLRLAVRLACLSVETAFAVQAEQCYCNTFVNGNGWPLLCECWKIVRH